MYIFLAIAGRVNCGIVNILKYVVGESTLPNTLPRGKSRNYSRVTAGYWQRRAMPINMHIHSNTYARTQLMKCFGPS